MRMMSSAVTGATTDDDDNIVDNNYTSATRTTIDEDVIDVNEETTENTNSKVGTFLNVSMILKINPFLPQPTAR